MEIKIIKCQINMDHTREPDVIRKITVKSDDGPVEVDARVYGPLALHPSVEGAWSAGRRDMAYPCVTLTHIKTGDALFSIQLNSAKDLIKMMEGIVANLLDTGIDWSFESMGDVSEDDKEIIGAISQGYVEGYKKIKQSTCDCPGCTTRRMLGIQ